MLSPSHKHPERYARPCGAWDCRLSEWTPAGGCADGRQVWTRTVLEPAAFGGAPCPGSLHELRRCRAPAPAPGPAPAEPAPLPGCEVSDWRVAGGCSAQCGGGEQVLVRDEIERPCREPLHTVVPCNEHACWLGAFLNRCGLARLALPLARELGVGAINGSAASLADLRALRHLREDELRAVPAIAAGDVSALLTCIHDKLGHHEEF